MKTLRNRSVLVIDDDEGMLRALDRVLTGEGASVTRASWAGDAVDILTNRDQQFDLVITDLRMPFVTGLTVVYAVHKIYPSLPVIVLTAFGSPDVENECFRQGAAAFLEKPLNTAELLAAVQKVFTKPGHQRGITGTERSESDYSTEEKNAEQNRLNARQPTISRQRSDPEVEAGTANRRKEKVYEYQSQQYRPNK